ncbi:acyl-CoA dehydrogenase family protein [Nocardiopsis sediminis]|uniref:Acyl-CoA dehydrogenase family protein n=1 Tax=Nocardiopsis sediminis TaxID=1778267 RepID=A0ABV8FTY7_9ACTN
MRFTLDAEQELFAATLDRMLGRADTPAAVRSWADGDRGPGEEIWRALAGAGLFALAAPESHGGAGPLPVELVTATIEVGRHAVPGPVAEAVAACLLLGDADRVAAIAAGDLVATLAHPPLVPYALDADAAGLVLHLDGGLLHTAAPTRPAAPLRSLDPARRLWSVRPADPLPLGPLAAAAVPVGVLACAAQALGTGMRLVADTVAYARTRHQFGRPIGEFQAVQHRLADAHTALEFARPLLYGAALAVGTPDERRDVSAAKAAASDAAYAAARTALQVHGAIGYTDEHDVSLWIRKARALHTAWGGPVLHRARVLAELRARR